MLETACIRTAVNMGIFDMVAAASTPLTAESIAARVPADAVLTGTIGNIEPWCATMKLSGS